MKTEIEQEFKTRKEFMIHLLKFLNEKPKGIELGEFFFSIMPSHGIDNFREILDEMERQKWINIVETPSVENVAGIQIPTKTIKYTISLEGIEYLDKLNIIVDKYKVQDSTKNKEKKIERLKTISVILGLLAGIVGLITKLLDLW